VLRILQRYYRAAGYDLPLRLEHKRKHDDATGNWWAVSATPVLDGVPVDSGGAGVTGKIDHITGVLGAVAFGDVPTPPSDLTPRLTLQEARDVAAAAVFAHRPHDALQEGRSDRLAIWSNLPPRLPNVRVVYGLTPEEEARIGNGGSRLAYLVNPVIVGEGGEVVGSYRAVVDAIDGRVLVLAHYNGGPGGPRPPSKGRAPKSLAQTWNAAKGSARAWASSPRKAMDARDARLLPAPQGTAARLGATVYLQGAGLTLRTVYDKTANVLTLRNGGREEHAVPSPTLRQALLRQE
jgi:hypothetical protein